MHPEFWSFTSSNAKKYVIIFWAIIKPPKTNEAIIGDRGDPHWSNFTDKKF